MPPQHPRPGITHHFADPFPQLRLMTADRAVGARRLVLPERTAGQSAYCVRLQFRTLGAQFAARRVKAATEGANHGRDRRLLAGNPTGAGRDNLLTGWGLAHSSCAIILSVDGGAMLRLREEPIDVLRSIVLRISEAAGPVGVSLPDHVGFRGVVLCRPGSARPPRPLVARVRFTEAAVQTPLQLSDLLRSLWRFARTSQEPRLPASVENPDEPGRRRPVRPSDAR